MAKRKALFSINASKVTWSGAVSPLFEPDPDEVDEVPPALVVWLDPDKNLAAFHLLEGEDMAEELVRTFRAAVTEANETRPVRLRLESPELVALLEPLLPEITLAVGPTPAAIEAWEAMADEFIRRWESLPEPSLLVGEGVTPEVVGALFEAAATFYEARVWEKLQDGPLQVDLPGMKREGLVLVMPDAAEEGPALVLLDSVEAFVDFASEDDEEEAPTGARAITLGPTADVLPEVRQETLRHGWRVASTDAHPLVACTDDEALPRQPNREDLELLTAALQAALRALEGAGADGLFPEGEDFRAELTATLADRSEPAVVVYPPARLEDLLTDEMLEEEDNDEDEDEDEDDDDDDA
ncbi:MAG: hypothetical protein H6730_01750 [Deltaproteobacteria bacterium]|nr:hypothetical protein [Deltaproteobacteria bacterium]